MKITGFGPQDIYKTFGNSKKDGEGDKGTAAAVTNSDRVEISAQGADISEARALAKKSYAVGESADERDERIESIKAQVESGEYNVSSVNVARSILFGRTGDDNT